MPSGAPRSLVAALIALTCLVPASRALAASCGDTSGPGATPVPCNCGDTVTTNYALLGPLVCTTGYDSGAANRICGRGATASGLPFPALTDHVRRRLPDWGPRSLTRPFRSSTR